MADIFSLIGSTIMNTASTIGNMVGIRNRPPMPVYTPPPVKQNVQQYNPQNPTNINRRQLLVSMNPFYQSIIGDLSDAMVEAKIVFEQRNQQRVSENNNASIQADNARRMQVSKADVFSRQIQLEMEQFQNYTNNINYQKAMAEANAPHSTIKFQ